ncbi:hypothetical protein D9758_002528 [Tetrapyrgos nigripes]|uniref:Protein kinase domain-containing protein n=1 Tax=Tetrapyrgos nigripes TaxID=182062 RepID=A0A8H5GRC0_9AGAR|nr:hypothetical protein D9758_002528 [Tetrapyrgos nigripes]
MEDGIENYQILNELATHGSSQTLQGRCKRGRMKNRLVVIKKTPISANNSSSTLQFSLHHPSINSLFSAFTSQTHQFQVLGLCAGGSLFQYIQRYGTGKDSRCLSDGMTRTIIKPLIDALTYLKKEGIVHRDLNPRSILLTEEGRVKLSNFEKAIRVTEQDFTSFTDLYKTGDDADVDYVYVAPEILSRRYYDCSADLWSLGCVAFACVAGKSPFQVDSIDQIFENILRAKYSMTAYFSALLENFVVGLLHIDPSRRTALSSLLHHPFLDTRLPEEPLEIDNSSEGVEDGKHERIPFQSKPFLTNTNRKPAKPQQLPFRAPSTFKENKQHQITNNDESVTDLGIIKNSISNARTFSAGSGFGTKPPLREIKNADLRRILSDEISFKRMMLGMDGSAEMQRDLKGEQVFKEKRVVSDTSEQSRRISLLGYNHHRAKPAISAEEPHPQLRVPSSSSQGTSASATRVHVVNPLAGSSRGEHAPGPNLDSFLGENDGPMLDMNDDLPVGTTRQVNVLPSGSLLIDFREAERRKGMKGHEVLIVSGDGNEIKTYSAPHLSIPCCLAEPLAIYLISDLPKIHWKQYNDAAILVSKIKQRTPRMVLHEQAMKCTLMANGPQADVELLFLDSTLISSKQI